MNADDARLKRERTVAEHAAYRMENLRNGPPSATEPQKRKLHLVPEEKKSKKGLVILGLVVLAGVGGWLWLAATGYQF